MHEFEQHRMLVRFGAWTCRRSINVRYTGQNHFLSDVLVGSAIGYGIGATFTEHIMTLQLIQPMVNQDANGRSQVYSGDLTNLQWSRTPLWTGDDLAPIVFADTEVWPAISKASGGKKVKRER